MLKCDGADISSLSRSRDIIDGVGFTDETSTTTHAHAQVANTYEENMVNYTHPQHGSSSGLGVPCLSSTLSNLNDVLTQWHPPPNALQHHGQPAPNLSVANSYTHDNYAHAYSGPSVASGPSGEYLFSFNVWLIVANILLYLRATATRVSRSHHAWRF